MRQRKGASGKPRFAAATPGRARPAAAKKTAMTARRLNDPSAFTRKVAETMGAAPPILDHDATLGAAVQAMRDAGTSSVLLADPLGRADAILTEQDITRRVAFRMDQAEPARSAATSSMRFVAPGDPLFRAVGLMRRHALRHMPVLDEAGRPVGMLHRAETLAVVSARLLAALETVVAPRDPAGFRAAKAAQGAMARTLRQDGAGTLDLLGLIGEINLDLHRSVLEHVLAAQPEPPPVPFTLLLMGSAGRGESLLAPDQDNGLILGPYDDHRHREVDAWFRRFAEALNLALDDAGFTLCRGEVMARNPVWRKRETEWREQFAGWANRRSGAALLFADIAFDFLPVWGDPGPASRLRAQLARLLQETPALLAALAAEDAKFQVGLSLFGGFRDDEAGPGTRTDLKAHGLVPLVASVRSLALARGVTEVGTLPRIEALARQGSLAEREADGLAIGFERIAGHLLDQQLADLDAGRAPGSLVETRSLPKDARNALRESLRAVGGFARAVRAGLAGAL